MKVFKKAVKASLLTLTTSAVALLATPSAYAQDPAGDALLAQILSTTQSILKTLNQTPAYVEAITEMAMSWLSKNKDDAAKINAVITNNQGPFANSNNNYISNSTNQFGWTATYTKAYLLSTSINPKSPALPSNANDLNYPILYGITLPNTKTSNPDQNAQNFIINASGINNPLYQPSPTWTQYPNATARYINYYNTIASINSFDAYAISHLYNQKENTGYANTLTAQASSSDWFTLVATESLGGVLRHILMYASQSYVELTRIEALQRQQLAATAMSNAVLIALSNNMVGQSLANSALRGT